MRVGFVGLGKMGSRMALKLLKEGQSLVVWNRSEEGISNFIRQSGGSNFQSNINLKIAKNIKDLVAQLDKTRIIWSMLPAGSPTENILLEIGKFVERGDIVIDGGNSFYKDTERRFKDFKNKGIRYLGIGVSGGIIAAKNGYPMMVGGDKSAYEHIIPILNSLSKPNGEHEYFGSGGAGHFVKMVHNAIEYGIMQSIGEGFGILEKSPYHLDLLKIAKLYQKGTLVSGFMLDRAVEVLSNASILSSIDGKIAESGEAKWAVEQAKKENVDIEIIERSLEFRRRSQTDSKVANSFSARLIAALRNAFGGHPVRHAQGKEVKKK